MSDLQMTRKEATGLPAMAYGIAGMKLDEDGGLEIYVADRETRGRTRGELDLSLNLRIHAPDLEKMKTWTPKVEKLGG